MDTEVKKTRIYISTPPYAFMAYCLVKHRDNSTLRKVSLQANDRHASHLHMTKRVGVVVTLYLVFGKYSVRISARNAGCFDYGYSWSYSEPPGKTDVIVGPTSLGHDCFLPIHHVIFPLDETSYSLPLTTAQNIYLQKPSHILYDFRYPFLTPPGCSLSFRTNSCRTLQSRGILTAEKLAVNKHQNVTLPQRFFFYLLNFFT
jgi:hypothetical protein